MGGREGLTARSCRPGAKSNLKTNISRPTRVSDVLRIYIIVGFMILRMDITKQEDGEIVDTSVFYQLLVLMHVLEMGFVISKISPALAMMVILVEIAL